ncbi:autotransporter domain-containing protein [Bradyrhizobium sp. Pear76]|uniref:autotransporter outer membrane beta-barrel domain-containing protein n=1 Tax=Bradyrhizobium oropedii TaxID=1571201 RepID=UPI001E2B743D|nr:autotransporter outer membrane beta-barrel domain-containing protein [Bradyrhizobium oropedii]MCC8961952.1 autotransporter domain-containing protein [Bradyrhizobium oropedii]
MWTERTRALRALLAGVVVIWAGPVAAAPAVNATWSTAPGSGDFNTATNWNPPIINPPSNAPNGTAFFDTSTITSLSLSANTQIGGFTFNAGAPAYSFSVGGPWILVFTGAGIVSNATPPTFSIGSGGGIQFSNSSSASTAVITNAQGGYLNFTDTSTAANAVIANSGTAAFQGAATAGNAKITNTGTGGVVFLNTSTAGNAVLTNSNAGTFDFSTSSGPNVDHKLSAGSIAGGGNFYLGADQLTVGGNNLSTVVGGVISDCGGGSDCFNRAHPTGGSLVKTGTGTLTLSGENTYTGGTTFAGGTIIASTAGSLGAGLGALTFNGGTLQLGSSFNLAGHPIILDAGGGTINTNGFKTEIAQPIDGTGGLTKSGDGVLVVAGQNTYTGATVVNGGVLDVKSFVNTASGVVVNSGGTLEGTGVMSTVTVNNGGTLAPGDAGAQSVIVPGQKMTISGNLAFQSGAIYLVQLNPSASSFVSVGGTATLGGATVNAVFASGSYVSKQYTILTAGAVSGTFGSFVNTNLPSNFHDSLSYDANNVYLNLALNFGIPNSLNGNQQAIGNALTNFFNTTGGIPMTYAMLTAAQLSQASGELATGSQQTTFQAMGQFMGLLTDPFTNRSGGANATPGATGYADEELGYAARKRDAYAMFTKAPLAKVYDPRWSVWAAGYGGSQSTSGNAVAGTNDTTSSIYGTAVGADYLFSPNTIVGFSLAGGGTNFSVANSGSGHSDLFQAGAYVRHTQGPAYVSAALAYGWQDITTNRTVTIAGIDQLRAQFNANAYSGRLEGGYRFLAPWIGGVGITPYAAGQFTTFDLPAYAESVVSGSGAFALAYGGKDVTSVRSELGIRTDRPFAMSNGVLTLRGRFAWAHDYDPNRSIAATFQALPGASFVVNGAAQAADSALTTASLEMKWMNGWSAAATFEGEFSSVTTSYAGKGVVRYQW